jgi:hypothetical protein
VHGDTFPYFRWRTSCGWFVSKVDLRKKRHDN